MWIIVLVCVIIILIWIIIDALSAANASHVHPSGFSIGLVTDTGGINDRSFNENTIAGMGQALEEYDMEGRILVSKSEANYLPYLERFAAEDNSVIIGVGSLLEEEIMQVAKQYPKKSFVLIDAPSTQSNVRGIVFDVHKPALQAGYLAAGMSKTGVVATYGGMDIPPIRAYMDGFTEGVERYNQVKGTKVRVLGRDTFANTFTDRKVGEMMARTFVDQKADVILPVAGPVGFGTLAYMDEQKAGYVIGVDTDWVLIAPEYRSIILTSIMKGMDVVTYQAIKDVYNGAFTGGTQISTITSLAPYYDVSVPYQLQVEVAAL